MPGIRPKHYEAGAKALDRSGDPFVAGKIASPDALREKLGMTAPKLPKLGTFKAPRAARRG
jgi:hypothetical protein